LPGIESIPAPDALRDLPQIAQLFVIGEPSLLDQSALSLFCSVKYPASVILKTYDLAQRLKDRPEPVISGFHSPIEKELLVTLLRGTVPIIMCPARSIHNMRIPTDWKSAIEAGQLLIVSPFAEAQNRPTAKTAEIRNQLVAHLANEVFIAYAEPEVKTEVFARQLLIEKLSGRTFDTESNRNLLEAGAETLTT